MPTTFFNAEKGYTMKSRGSGSKTFQKIIDSVVYCPSCSTWRTRTPFAPPTRPLSKSCISSQTRRASTLSSNTAINATKSVPPKYQDLYTALSQVRQNASPFVGLSRLHLAQQGLESTSPKTKVAVLGLNVQDTARRLVRLLLADPLESEAAWEKELAILQGDQGILVTYGQPSNTNLSPSRTSIPTFYVPSSLLERSNLEILISSVRPPQTGDGCRTIPSDTLLSPTVTTPTAASGRHTLISQPIHASLILSKGLDELLTVADLLSAVDFTSPDEKNSVTVGIDLGNSNLQPTRSTLVLDLDRAEHGLSAIRKSISDTPAYARDWNQSGMLQINNWLTSVTSPPSTDHISEPIRRLVSSILAAATANIQSQTQDQLTAQNSSILSLATRTNLEAAIDEFSRNAHQELQSGLASAWSSRNWRKLAWYKLFWRVDDVGLIITDLVSNAWLPKTERAVYELSGRLAQVGISPMDAPAEATPTPIIEQLASTTPQNIATIQAQFATTSEIPLEPIITNPSGTAKLTMSPIPLPQPLPRTISIIRATTISHAITDVTSTAQQLVLRTLSITGLSAGLSGLTYVSFVNSMYEAGTIVAIGTIFALWRMQSGWMRKTRELEDGLFDEGRKVIGRVVERMRGLVVDAGKEGGGEGGVRRLRIAMESVERARGELGKLTEDGARERVVEERKGG